MEVNTIILLTHDTHGNKSYAVCSDMSDCVQICGMKDVSGESVYFESEAYHLKKWCNDNNIHYKGFGRSENFNTLWNEAL